MRFKKQKSYGFSTNEHCSVFLCKKDSDAFLCSLPIKIKHTYLFDTSITIN